MGNLVLVKYSLNAVKANLGFKCRRSDLIHSSFTLLLVAGWV